MSGHALGGCPLVDTDGFDWVPTVPAASSSRSYCASTAALFLEMRDKGATIHRSLRTEPWDQVTFVACDLDGNLISFGSPMPLTISER